MSRPRYLSATYWHRMIFATSLILIAVAGLLAVQADDDVRGKRFDIVAALMLMLGLSLIGWGLDFRH